ncbi:MAG: hypothetical protein M3357_17700 [Actinomycetota bacterium]|nr:hypothetical protein [Actinomycetota bacterium]
MTVGTMIGSVGRGLAAGMVGTAAITASMALERKLRGEPENTMAADAAEEVLHIEPEGKQGKLRLARSVHWIYGTAWGGARGLLGALGLRGPAGDAAHFAAVSGTAMVMPPALGVAPPPQDQPPAAMASSAVHHLIYALATGATYRALERSARPARRGLRARLAT